MSSRSLWRRARLSGFIGATALGIGIPAVAQAQEGFRVEPTFAVYELGSGSVLEISLPEGWRLYAPTPAGEDASQVGLPLRIVALPSGEHFEPGQWPTPLTLETVAGRGYAYTESVDISLEGLPAGVSRLEVSWALCQEDLCIPGRTQVTVPADMDAGVEPPVPASSDPLEGGLPSP